MFEDGMLILGAAPSATAAYNTCLPPFSSSRVVTPFSTEKVITSKFYHLFKSIDTVCWDSIGPQAGILTRYLHNVRN